MRCLEDGVGVGRCLQSPIKKFRMSQQTTEGLSEKEHHEWVCFRKVSLAVVGRTHWGRTGFFKPEKKDFGPPGGCFVWRMLCGPSSKVHFRPRDLEQSHLEPPTWVFGCCSSTKLRADRQPCAQHGPLSQLPSRLRAWPALPMPCSHLAVVMKLYFPANFHTNLILGTISLEHRSDTGINIWGSYLHFPTEDGARLTSTRADSRSGSPPNPFDLYVKRCFSFQNPETIYVMWYQRNSKKARYPA